MDAIVTAIVGGLILAMLGWIKIDLDRLSDKVDRMDERLSARISDLTDRVSRIEGRLDDRERRT